MNILDMIAISQFYLNKYEWLFHFLSAGLLIALIFNYNEDIEPKVTIGIFGTIVFGLFILHSICRKFSLFNGIFT